MASKVSFGGVEFASVLDKVAEEVGVFTEERLPGRNARGLEPVGHGSGLGSGLP